MKRNKVETKEIGLVIGSILGKYFFETEDLHYGYWTEGLELNKNNFAKAQSNHSNFIMSHIPENTKTILDVGCGVGTLAEKLIKKGFSVDCLCPNDALTKRVREKLGDQSNIFQCLFEDMKSGKTYDLVLFSESFQYVKLSKVLQQSSNFLKKGGHLLICDFFKKDSKGKSVLKGGHRLSKFYDAISAYPFEPVKNIDITEQTAPNLELADKALRSVGLPIWNLIFYYLDSNRPIISSFLKWKYKKKIEKVRRRYFGGEINAQNFKKHHSYRLLLYRKESL